MSSDPTRLLRCPACGCLDLVARGTGVRCGGCGGEYPGQDGVLRFVSGGAGLPGYDPHFFETLPQVEATHFWFLARRQVIADGLRRAVGDWASRPLFDVGCGSGGLLRHLMDSGIPVSGACDAYLEGLQIARRRLAGVPLVLVDEHRLPPLAPGQPMIGLFDVLEHLDDDRGTLARLNEVLAPGGVLVLTVPAHSWLFDEMDELAHHRRRYGRAELRGKLVEAGFEIRVLTHFMALVLPLVLARRLGRLIGGAGSARARQSLELSVIPGVNGVMRTLLSLERLWLRFGTLPFGTSILAIAVRPGEGTAALRAPA